MTNEDPVMVVDRWRTAWTRGDVAMVAALYAEDAVVESPLFGTLVGRIAIQQSFRNWFTAFPDARVEFSDAPVVRGNRVVQAFTAVGTDTGGLLGQHATARPFQVFVVLLHDVVDGYIVHERRVLDLTGVLLQLARGESGKAETTNLYRAVLSTVRLEHEMAVAAAIQRGLLPAPSHQGSTFEIAATSLPCRAIGGDFLDYFDLAEEQFAFVLGDVAGKGAPAALLAAKIQGMVAMCSDATRAPSETMALLNKELVRRSIESRFATLFYAMLSVDGRLSYCNAGHNPPFILGRRGVTRLDQGGVPAGLFVDAVFHQETILLDQDDVLIAFSDGVVEAMDGDGMEFGEERLLATVKNHQESSPTALIELILTAVRAFTANVEQHDDITAIVLRYGRVWGARSSPRQAEAGRDHQLPPSLRPQMIQGRHPLQ